MQTYKRRKNCWALIPRSEATLHGGAGWWNPPYPTRQRVDKLLSQSAKLDWLMITPEQTEMDNILNIWQKEYFYSFICKS